MFVREGVVHYSASDLTNAVKCEWALMRLLDAKLGRIPAALAAIARYAVDFREWGIFWIAVVIAALVVGRRGLVALAAMVLALAAYVIALSVTSWSIDDLAKVVVNRLLLHLLVPGAWLLAAALAPRNTQPAPVVTAGP